MLYQYFVGFTEVITSELLYNDGPAREIQFLV